MVGEMNQNRVLGDAGVTQANRRHRVAICSWPTMMGPKDPRSATLDGLLGFVKGVGFEGVEYSHAGYAHFFPGDSLAVRSAKLSKKLSGAGLEAFGATIHLRDEAMRKLGWMNGVREDIKFLRDLGCGFVSFQYGLAQEYLSSGGEYRNDEGYLKWCAENLEKIRSATWGEGMNFYLEVHINMITEDPTGCCRVLDLFDCEINGDLSHYLFKGYLKGKSVERVISKMGHTHTRMARQYGDLSAVVSDPKADWEAKGMTWQLFELMKPALAKGLSSRTISGETGPMHLVVDSLSQEQALVPLWRAMARYADAGAQGVAMKVEGPGDLRPWG